MLRAFSAYSGVTLTATYQGAPGSAILVVTGAGTGSGTVASQAGLSPAIDCTITDGVAGEVGCSATYPVGTSVTLTAAAADGSVFSGWSGTGIECTSGDACTVVMDAARTVTATFTAVQVLTVAGGGTGSGTVTSQAGVSPAIDCTITDGVAGQSGCSATYPVGTSVTLTAAAASGSLFLSWNGTGISCPPDAPCTLVVIQPLTVTAGFVVEPSAEFAADDLLGTPRLSSEQRTALDQVGNKNGRYDVGDYLALLDRQGLTALEKTNAMGEIEPADAAETPLKKEPEE
jgi:hypothetical protein